MLFRSQHLTHDMENVFQEVRNDKIKVNGDIIDVLFQCLDAIEGYLNIIKETSDEGTNDNEGIIASLNGILNGDTAAAALAPKEDKEVPAAAVDTAAEKKYLSMDLSENDHETAKNAEESGKVLFGFTVYVQKECLLKAARAFLVFKAVEEFGEILAYQPSAQDIEDEKFDLDFSFLLASDEEGVEKFISAAKAVSEIEDVIGEQIKYEMLVDTDKKAKEPEEDKSAATGQNVPAAVSAAAASAKDDQPKANNAAAKGKPVNKPVANRTVRVDIEKLDALMNQVSELIIAKNSLVSISSSDSGDRSEERRVGKECG